MNVLSLGLDRTALDPQSPLSERLRDYGRFTDSYTVIVPAKKKLSLDILPNVKVFGSGGAIKVWQLYNVYHWAAYLLKTKKFSFITVQDPYYVGLAGVILAFRFRLPLEIQVHGFEKEYWWRRKIASFVIRRATRVRVVSQRLGRELAANLKLPEEKITILPISVQTSIQAGHDYSPRRPFTFLTVSRLVPIKNIILQLEAAAEVKKQTSDIRIQIVGAGPMRGELELAARKLGLLGEVNFVGQVEDPSPYYEAADVFIFSSNREGWGLAVVEAASFGLPIIMTDVGCAGEVIKNEDSGLVIPVGDVEALARSMIRLYRSEADRRRLGQAAQVATRALPGKEETLALYRAAWEKLVY